MIRFLKHSRKFTDIVFAQTFLGMIEKLPRKWWNKVLLSSPEICLMKCSQTFYKSRQIEIISRNEKTRWSHKYFPIIGKRFDPLVITGCNDFSRKHPQTLSPWWIRQGSQHTRPDSASNFAWQSMFRLSWLYMLVLEHSDE